MVSSKKLPKEYFFFLLRLDYPQGKNDTEVGPCLATD